MNIAMPKLTPRDASYSYKLRQNVTLWITHKEDKTNVIDDKTEITKFFG